MKWLRYRCWEIEYDEATTRQIYNNLNYKAHLNLPYEIVYPKEVRDLLSKLGIDCSKAKFWPDYFFWSKSGEGYLFGSFYGIGRVVKDLYENIDDPIMKEFWILSNTKGNLHVEKINNVFFIRIENEETKISPPYKNNQTIKIEFAVYIPWLLNDPRDL